MRGRSFLKLSPYFVIILVINFLVARSLFSLPYSPCGFDCAFESRDKERETFRDPEPHKIRQFPGGNFFFCPPNTSLMAPKSYRRPDTVIGGFIWRWKIWFETTFALSMLERWEKIFICACPPFASRVAAKKTTPEGSLLHDCLRCSCIHIHLLFCFIYSDDFHVSDGGVHARRGHLSTTTLGLCLSSGQVLFPWERERRLAFTSHWRRLHQE